MFLFSDVMTFEETVQPTMIEHA